MLSFDETTLERAAAVYGPFRLEHRFLQDYGRLNREAGGAGRASGGSAGEPAGGQRA